MKLIPFLLLLPILAGCAGLSEELAFRDDGVASSLKTSARMLSVAEAIDYISTGWQNPIDIPVIDAANDSEQLLVCIHNTTAQAVWGSARVLGRGVNFPVSFFIGAHGTYQSLSPITSSKQTQSSDSTELEIHFETLYQK